MITDRIRLHSVLLPLLSTLIGEGHGRGAHVFLSEKFKMRCSTLKLARKDSVTQGFYIQNPTVVLLLLYISGCNMFSIGIRKENRRHSYDQIRITDYVNDMIIKNKFYNLSLKNKKMK